MSYYTPRCACWPCLIGMSRDFPIPCRIQLARDWWRPEYQPRRAMTA